jgi:flagellar hook-associated protein 2
LFLTAETGASTATVYVGRSLSETLQLFASEMLASGGDIDEKISSLDEDVADYEEKLVSIGTKMETIRARYIAQFAAMDTLVAQLKSTETTITNMMESWKASLK